MKKENILVSGASGIVGYGILRNLKGAGYRLIGTTIYKDSPANCFSDVVEIVPRAVDMDYIPCLVRLIEKHNIAMLIPGIEDDMIAWHQHRDIIEETGAVLLLNNADLVSACIDKWAFYEKLRENHVGCRIESSLTPNFDQYDIPFIVKPRRGYGSKGIVVIQSEQEFEIYRDRIGRDLMMQEYVGSDKEEYTVSCFFNKKSEIVASIAMKRKLSTGGYTEVAETTEFRQFTAVIEELALIFHPVGPTNFQFRKDRKGWRLLEINPRISSSTSIKAGFGYNECTMAVNYFLEGNDALQHEIRRGRAIRYTEDYFIYEDRVDI